MKIHAPAYSHLSTKVKNYSFPNATHPIALQNGKAALQIFQMTYVWNIQKKKYEISEFHGKVWLP
jgi:hypothetical protein